MKKLLLTLWTACLIMVLCGNAIGKEVQTKELTNFNQSAKSLLSALDAGINYQQYSDMVVQLKIAGDSAKETLEKSPNFQKKIDSILGYFLAARNLWEVQVSEKYPPCINQTGIIEEVFSRRYPNLQKTIDKYPFLSTDASADEDFLGERMHVLNITSCCQILWQKAKDEITLLKLINK